LAIGWYGRTLFYFLGCRIMRLQAKDLMTIRYTNGTTIEAVLLSHDGNALRAAAPDAEDVIEFTNVNGTWVSDDCEPVQIEFAWQRHGRAERVTEDDCVCPQDLAARLVHLLLNPAEDARLERIALMMAEAIAAGAAAVV